LVVSNEIVIAEEEGLLSHSDDGRGESISNGGPSNGQRHVGILEAARSSEYRPAVIAVIGVMLAQQLCGNTLCLFSYLITNAAFTQGSIV